MGYEEDLLRENIILQKNVKELQAQLQQAYQRIKHLSGKSQWAEISNSNSNTNQIEMNLKSDENEEMKDKGG